MKKTKKILAVLLAVILIAAAVPFNAFAANVITSADFTFAVEPGTKMEDYEDYITINTPGLNFSDYMDPPIDVSEVYKEEMYWPSSDCFEYGCEYEVLALFEAKSGYALPESQSKMGTVAVNGEEVYFELDTYADDEGTDHYILFVYIPVVMEKTVSTVELTVNPVAAYLIDDYYRYVSIDSRGATFEETLDVGVSVTDSLGGDPFVYFVEDEEYNIKICITPSWGCEFAKDESGNIALDKVTVNGEAVDYTSNIVSDRGYIEYIIVEVSVVPEEKKIVDEIYITLEDDLKGYDVEDYDDYITIEGEGVIFDKYDPYAVMAFDSFGNEVTTFEGGDYYYLALNFITEEGYVFSPDGVIIYINGEEYAYVDYETYYPEDDLKVEYVYIEMETDVIGNVFDLIIAWFKTIFEQINAFLFGWM